MATVVLAPYNVASFPEAGGHFWVYMQCAAALASLGCDVYWMEQLHARDSIDQENQDIRIFLQRMTGFGFDRKVILYKRKDPSEKPEFLTMDPARAEDVMRRADLLINFHYSIG